jgi:hypothetical protein
MLLDITRMSRAWGAPVRTVLDAAPARHFRKTFPDAVSSFGTASADLLRASSECGATGERRGFNLALGDASGRSTSSSQRE